MMAKETSYLAGHRAMIVHACYITKLTTPNQF
jgi:hypothetical protein